MIFGPAIGIVEFSSIARGYFVLDQIVKKAPVKVLEASAVSPGKFFILFNGDEASVEESYKESLAHGAGHVIDKALIPQLHREILPAMYGQNNFRVNGSLGIVELATISAGFISADAAAKSANVNVIDFRVARGIGGKSFFFLTGSQDNVEAGVQVASAKAQEKSLLIRAEIIPSPHEDFLTYFNVEGSP